jgi:hypothetical protein
MISTLDDFIRVLEVNISRADLADFYKDWVRSGLQQICQDFSFNCMRMTARVTIAAGASFVALPDDFKELTRPRSPISLVSSTDSSLQPVNVTRREDLIATRTTLYTVGARSLVDVFLSNNGDSWTLNLLDATTTPATFDVSYFRVLPPLEDGKDSNYLTETYPELVKAKIKSIGFDEVNDPLAAFWDTKYVLQLARAKQDDLNRFTLGRTLQMGGN